jgi:galactonate dehydratase
MAAIPNALILERIEDDWPERRNVIVPYPEQHEGYLTVPDAPGLGCDIDEEVVARYPSQGNVAAPAETDNPAYGPGTVRENVYVQTRLRRGAYFRPEDKA